MQKKILTLCCVYNDTHILLGEKKYGKLAGLWNGFGGKIEEGETIEQAAIRELHEECCIVPKDMEKRGVILFKFDENGNPFEGNPVVEVHIYSVTQFEGEPIETNEMRPEWFSYENIPYDSMWPDDLFWLPLLLDGKNFKGTFHFVDKDTISSYELKEVDFVQ
jgi:8-oxo-dGTP diphosphatase/2-hydroxy-dATP diphosphatase